MAQAQNDNQGGQSGHGTGTSSKGGGDQQAIDARQADLGVTKGKKSGGQGGNAEGQHPGGGAAGHGAPGGVGPAPDR